MSSLEPSGFLRSARLVCAVAGLVASGTGTGCKGASASAPPDAGVSANGGVEWVNFSTQVPLTNATTNLAAAKTNFDALVSGMFGADAQAGKFLDANQMAQAFFVTSAAEPSTPTQVRLTFAMDDGSQHRTLAMTPASYAVGKVFIATADAAIAQLAADVASNNAQGEIFDIEYQATSTQGGTLSFGLLGNQGQLTLSLNVTTPHTSLQAGSIGQAATYVQPTDNVAATVWFNMSKDEFDYFVNHAYGSGATSNQNFSDFALVPYSWLRLSVTPELTQQIVNVGFVLLEPDGTRVPVAKAPASFMAGSTFQAVVDRQMSNMIAQEAALAGSSIPWSVPYYYDQPEGGGVVKVIAQGAKGIFSVAYAVASPLNPLVDVPFVAYVPVTITPPDQDTTEACNELGNPAITLAQKGVFQITFKASSTITTNLAPGQKLVGNIDCSIYESQDVTIEGPVANAVDLEDFTVPNVDLLAATPPTFTTTTQLYDGSYQILCAQYVDGNNNAVDQGDPVTLPIGAYSLACNLNPITIEFALLNPSNQP